VKTSKGYVSVLICGDQDKPALITYPDVALNCNYSYCFAFYVYSICWIRIWMLTPDFAIRNILVMVFEIWTTVFFCRCVLFSGSVVLSRSSFFDAS